MTIERQQIINEVEKILGIKVTNESKNTDFTEWDSLGTVQLAAGLESKLGVPIPDDVYFFSMKEIFDFYGI
jgi:acyl carrier protein